MVEDWVVKTMYATRRRKRNTRKSVVVANGKCSGGPTTALIPGAPGGLRGSEMVTGVRSNPSKRHRERLNIELECLADLLPFDNAIVSKLDKLSILRLASSYLKSKCYLRTCAESCPDLSDPLPYLYSIDDPFQTMDGFLLVVTTDGELFFSSSNVEMFLGFHQSDILHQSVLELIHSEDREMFKEQLEWNHRTARQESLSTPRRPGVSPKQNDEYFLERSFTARFRCLLDNTSGFVTMDVTGRLQPFPPGFPNSLTGGNNLAAASAGIRTRPSPTSNSSGGSSTGAASGSGSFDQNHVKAASVSPQSSTSSGTTPTLALFAFCQPFGPGAFPVAAGQIDLAKTFKSKHALDMSFLSVDPRVRQVIEGSDEHDFFQVPFYNVVHVADLNYVATAHAELMKRGSCGILAYRIVVGGNGKLGGQASSNDGTTGSLVWLQTSARIVYRCNKADTILCIHRRLSDDEGEGLIMKRALEFRLPCALFDAVDAASANPSNQLAGSKLESQPPLLDEPSEAASTTFSSTVPITRPPPAIVPLQLEPPAAKKAKTATKRGKNATTKQKLAEQSSLPIIPSMVPSSDQPSSVLLPHQAAVATGAVEPSGWPALVGSSCGYGSYLPNYYSSTSTMAEQFGSNFLQQQHQSQFNQTAYPTPELTSYYYHQHQQQQLGGYPPLQAYEEFTANTSTPVVQQQQQQQQPCLYGTPDLTTLAASTWNSRLNSEKILTAYTGAYRFMYDDEHAVVSPSGTGSEESPQLAVPTEQQQRLSTAPSTEGFASVIRHTTTFQQQQQLQHQYQSANTYEQLASSGFATPVTTTMFQGAQPIYAATPTSHFIA